MGRNIILTIFIFTFFRWSSSSGSIPTVCFHNILSLPDTSEENQILHNGRIWINLYYMVEGDQFLLSRKFLPGSLTISGKTYTNISLKYDIFKDEVLTPVDLGGILQLNKELVDSFSLFFQNKSYLFIRMQQDSLKGLKKYYNVLYKGKTALYVSYSKKIDKLSVEGKYDQFYQLNRIHFIKDNIDYLIDNKSELMKILVEDKKLIKNFIKKNKLDVSAKEPESFIPVIRYYDSISQ